MGRLISFQCKWWLFAILSAFVLKVNLFLLGGFDIIPESTLVDNQPHVHVAKKNSTAPIALHHNGGVKYDDDDKSSDRQRKTLPYNNRNHNNGNTHANAKVHDPSLPYFVIHMGPPKTATSSLQEELTARNDPNSNNTKNANSQSHLLLADNYVYAGAYMKDGQLLRFDTYSTSNATTAIKRAMTDLQCQAAVYKARTNNNHTYTSTQSNAATHTNNTSSSSSSYSDGGGVYYPPCWQNFRHALDESQGRNILLSQEIMSFRLMSIREKGRPAPVDWVALKQALEGRWNLVVVVAYRRLTEWLPSAKQQNERWNALKPAMNNWPGNRSLGRHIPPIFPHVLHHLDYIQGSPRRPPKWLPKNSRKFQYLYVSNVMELLRAHDVPFIILNLHQPEPLLVTFFCHVLPNAAHNCAASRQQATVDGTRGGEGEKRANREQSVAYDMLATAAAVRGLFDRHVWARHTVALAAKEYHERVMNSTRWILTCPSKHDLESYLQASLSMEADLLPDFYQSDAGEQQHRAEFATAVARKKYCWINAPAVLEQPVWRDFFRHTFSSSPVSSSLLSTNTNDNGTMK
jgi:hypothetical protein